MNIKRAKEEIEHTVKAYLAKDALGEYAIPAIRQRPILLMGPPGIGKTQVMEQVARECGVALVAYTITHHTRQSAVGLPFIRQRHYGDKDVSVTEYTMSEIIASIYAKMEATGLSEGILFIDEINCVSETLAPTMLQFLQCKTFGNQAVPAGWVIVAAGNPPEYNKSVRDFDIVTLDRVRRMDIEPDLPVWKDYARAAHIHSAILSYLELHPQNFYQINADVDGTQFVTARGWEDLSNLLDTYEALGLQADEELIREYIQHPKIAEDFSAYLDLYYKYRDDYGVEEILAGQTKPAVFARLLQAPFDERLSLVSLLLAGLDTRFTASLQADAVADACYAFLRETKKALATLPEDIPDGSAELFSQQIKDYEAETQQKRDAGLLGKAELTNRLQVQAALHQWEGELRRANAAGTQEAFDLLRGQFRALADQREAAQKTAAAALEAAFDFMEQAFAESQEMVVFVTELTVNPASHQFLTENGCERYFKYNKDLLLDHEAVSSFLLRILSESVAAALAVLAILFQLAHDGLRIDALTAVVVGQSSLDGLLGKNRAVHLDRGQTFQSLHNGLVGQLQRLIHGLALDQVGGHAAGGNGCAAAKGEELDVHDHIVLNFQVHAHDVAALGIAHFTHAVCIGQLTYVVRICEMLHDLGTIHTCHNYCSPFRLNWRALF